MSKKIQMGTVRQEANVEVLFVNASIISKAIHALVAANSIMSRMTSNYNPAIKPTMAQAVNENGEGMVDENGCEILEQAVDENGNKMFDYDNVRLDAEYVEQFHTRIVPFIQELVDAFEQ